MYWLILSLEYVTRVKNVELFFGESSLCAKSMDVFMDVDLRCR